MSILEFIHGFGEKDISSITDLIKNLYKEQNLSHIELIKKGIVELNKNLISDSDKKLLQFLYKKDVTQKDFDEFEKGYDIEAHTSDRNLMLSCFMKNHPELKFSDYTRPRLNGVFNYWRFANLNLVSHFTKIGKELNKNGIVPMIIKGGLLRYLRPEIPRAMGDIDILISNIKDYERCHQFVTDLGYEYHEDIHSMDLHLPNSEAGICDIHHCVDLAGRYDHTIISKFFERATIAKVFGVDCFIPCPEDLCFILLTNMAKNMQRCTSNHAVLTALFDINFVISLKKDFDYDLLFKNIVTTKTEDAIFLAETVLNSIVQGVLPISVFDDKKIEKKIKRKIDRELFCILYVKEYKEKCKKLKIKNAVKSFDNLKTYIKYKVPHFFTKRIVRHHLYINLFFKLFR